MTSNFTFLQPHFPEIYSHAQQAESLIHTTPRGSCFYARFTLEQAIHWLYDNDPYLRLPYNNPADNSLGALIHEQTFKDNLKPGLFPKIRTIHKVGNLAAHSANKITEKDALQLNEELFHFLYWLTRYYTPQGRTLPPLSFDRTLLTPAQTPAQDLTLTQLNKLETQLAQTDQLRRIAEAQTQQTETQLAQLKAERDAILAANASTTDTHNYQEADTRKYLIDVLLKEAAWPIHQPDWTEYEVQGMPNTSGKGRVDYVLWGDNGKPLALIEAKRTTASATQGKHQAEL